MIAIRFLQTTASAQPEYPFQAGQILHVPKLTPDMKRWLKEERIEIVKDESETAVDEHRETAVMGKARR